MFDPIDYETLVIDGTEPSLDELEKRLDEDEYKKEAIAQYSVWNELGQMTEKEFKTIVTKINLGLPI